MFYPHTHQHAHARLRNFAALVALTTLLSGCATSAAISQAMPSSPTPSAASEPANKAPEQRDHTGMPTLLLTGQDQWGTYYTAQLKLTYTYNALGELSTDADWDRVFSVNIRAVFRLCRAAIPALRARAAVTGRARIINTASVMAERTDLGLSAYTASKHAVAGLSKTLALELGKHGITVNYLLPGAIHTGMTAKSFADEKIAAIWAKKAALRRLGQPIDMARSVLLLASDEADFITGHGLVADGGLTLRT